MTDGAGSKAWGLAPGGISTWTWTRSPPIFRQKSPRGKMVAATGSGAAGAAARARPAGSARQHHPRSTKARTFHPLRRKPRQPGRRFTAVS